MTRVKRRRGVGAAIVLLPLLASVTGPGHTDESDAAVRAGIELMAQGRFAQAIEAFEAAEAQAARAPERIDAIRRLAHAEQQLGAHRRAVGHLERALELAQTIDDAALQTLLRAQLGGAYLSAGENEKARTLLQQAADAARGANDHALLAAVLNDLGTLHDIANAPQAALDAYDEAARFALDASDRPAAVRARLNAARVQLRRGNLAAARGLALTARDGAGALAHPYLKAQALLGAGQMLIEIVRRDTAAPAALDEAYAPLRAALGLGRDLENPHIASAAYGSLGLAYRTAGRHAEALEAARAAIHLAQQAQANELLFHWHWLAGRLFRDSGRPDNALASYRLAFSVYRTQSVAPATAGTLFVTEPPTAAFLELTDLLLQDDRKARSAHASQARLREARDVIEALKTRELQDYFRDSCVAEARARVRTLEQSIDPATAVLYPIVLPDRLELLLSHGSDIVRATVDVRADTLLDTAREFRAELVRQRTLRYLAHAQALYGWLIRPLEKALAARGVTTLVAVPDYALRAVPFAALHNGERFLIERFATATVPALELTDPRPLPERNVTALLAGLTEPTQGFPGLAYVETELASVRRHYPGPLLVDDAFQRARLAQELTGSRYTIAHIASHGEFSGDARQSFVLAHDGKITMDELARHIGVNRVSDDPLDLLTLSACHTAAGDERAALGLAGIAVKAGARSVVAALWPVHDEATALLMAEFYRALRETGVTKAAALQRAQQKLTGITRYRHPGYWSAFVLVGNWR